MEIFQEIISGLELDTRLLWGYKIILEISFLMICHKKKLNIKKY